MSFAAGGKIRQKIYEDPRGPQEWFMPARVVCGIMILNTQQWRELSGTEPHPPPVSMQHYARCGLPWFSIYDEAVASVAAPQVLADLKPVPSGTGAKPSLDDEEADDEDESDAFEGEDESVQAALLAYYKSKAKSDSESKGESESETAVKAPAAPEDAGPLGTVGVAKQRGAKPPANNCAVCKRATTQRCSSCHVEYYCSAECQKSDWQSHKATCKKH